MLEGVRIIRPVVVKVRITDKYKKAFVRQLQNAVQKLELDLQHLEYQAKRISQEFERQKTEKLKDALQEIENERIHCSKTRTKLVEKIRDVGRLNPGDELEYTRVESVVDVNIGDNWAQLANKEIIIEDDIVIDIRSTVMGKGIGDG